MSIAQDGGLSEVLGEILERYPVEDIGEGISDPDVRQLLTDELPAQINAGIEATSFEVHGSAGQGRWTAIPWVAVRDPRESASINEGVYVVYLFEPQEQRVHLTLNQGVKRLKEEFGMGDARRRLREHAQTVRQQLSPDGFTAGELEFTHASNRNKLYGPGTIFYKTYTLDALPDPQTAKKDLQTIVTAYENFVEGRSTSDDEKQSEAVEITPSTEREYRALWLRDRYREARDWEARKRAAEQTSAAVRRLADALVESSKPIQTNDLTALFRLCQHSDQIRVETKRDAVRNLALPEEAREEVLAHIDETIGSVGGPNFNQEIPDAETGRRVHKLLKTLLSTEDASALDAAVAEFAENEVLGLQSGSLSPILHYLHPTHFPVINKQPIRGMKRYFGESVSQDFDDYLECCETFRQIREQYGFEQHFRDLDYFFIWANQKGTRWDHNWTWMLTEDGDSTRDVYGIQPGTSGSDGGPDVRPSLWEVWREKGIVSVGGGNGDLRELSEKKRKTEGKKHGWGATKAWNLFTEMSPGDIVIAKYGQKEFRGIGVIKSKSYDYDVGGLGYPPLDNGGTAKHPHIRSVEWIITNDDGWTVSEIDLSTSFDRATVYEYGYFEELRYKLAAKLSDGADLFEELERQSREYTGSPETEFKGADSTKGATTAEIIDREEPPAIDLSHEELFGHLYYPQADRLANQIVAALRAGKHIVFTGPPGTGKTELAENVAGALLEIDNTPFTDSRLTTATADWTTFDTVGGRVPQGASDKLVFSPGIVLERFKRNERQQNDLLIIDELNRADIDKAFGQLFTVLSGQRVQLPFERDGESVEIIPAESFQGHNPEPHEYVVPESWRLFATMNSYDKTTLYEMSYAFMRRLAFINVAIPDLGSDRVGNDPVEFMAPYLAGWFETSPEAITSGALDSDEALPNEADVEAVVAVWQTLATGEFTRPIGPAIVEDMLRHMNYHDGTADERLADAISGHVLSQLEGIPDRKKIVRQLCELPELADSAAQLRATAATMLDISLDDGSGSSGE